MAENKFNGIDGRNDSAGWTLAVCIFSRLAIDTADPPGVTRPPYGPGEQVAHDIVRAEAEALGARVEIDGVGNLYMTFFSDDGDMTPWLIGSHLDSVRHGGNFDGAAGVIAGLSLVADLKQRGERPVRPVTVVAFRAEEAWFPLSYPGSEAMLGQLPASALEVRRSDSGRTLRDHMTEAGFDPESASRGDTHLKPENIAAFLEVHIEQGPALLEANIPVGLVTAIAGGFRYTHAHIDGEYGHSGANPRRHRRDVVLGFSDFMGALEKVWDGIEARGQDATITIGRLQSDPTQHGGSKVLGRLDFCLDVRSQYADVLDEVRAQLVPICAEIKSRRGVDFTFGEEFTWPIATMSEAVIAGLELAATRAGIAAMRMPSGAGHDAAVLAAAGVPTAMLFVRNENGSHNPDEAMEIADLMAAVAVLRAYVTAAG